MKIIKRVLFILLILFLLSGIFYIYFIYSLNPSIKNGSVVEFLINENENLKDISKKLESYGLIRNKFIFEIYLRYKNIDKTIRAGEYRIQNINNINDLISVLQKGQEKLIKYTIPEGYTIKQIAEKLSKEKIIDKEEFLNLAQKDGNNFDFQFKSELDNNLEGFLYPETYLISRPDSEKVIKQMLDQFTIIFDEKMRSETKNIGYSIKNVIILASIIEKEAKNDNERALVSSVFHNRLKIGMNLEACSTVEYVITKESYLLTLEDLKYDSPYNTYKYPGLPPAPICNPGYKSIIAAINPANTEYLFFVAKGDGSNVFSKTYEEHLKNVRKYLP